MNLFARALAHASDKEQAEFFNDFAEEMHHFQGTGLDMQTCAISYLVRGRFVEFCKSISEYNELHEQDRTTTGEKLRRAQEELRRIENEIRERHEAKDGEQKEFKEREER